MHIPIFFIGCEPITNELSEYDFDSELYTSLNFRNGVDYISFDRPRNESAKTFFGDDIGFKVEKMPVENSKVVTLKVYYDEKKFNDWIGNKVSFILKCDNIPEGKSLFEIYRNVMSARYEFDYPVVLTIGCAYDTILDFFASKWYAPKDGDIFYVQAYDCHV